MEFAAKLLRSHFCEHALSLYADGVAIAAGLQVEISDPRVLRTRNAALAAARNLLITKGIAEVTHLNVANESGVGRKTLYRHWATAEELLHATFSTANFPQAKRTGVVRADLVAHLEALRRALVDGPLAYLLHALNERAATDPAIGLLRDRLTSEGCEPIREILRNAIASDQLPLSVDIEEASSLLEGPLFYRVLVRNERVAPRVTVRLVDQFLASHLHQLSSAESSTKEIQRTKMRAKTTQAKQTQPKNPATYRRG